MSFPKIISRMRRRYFSIVIVSMIIMIDTITRVTNVRVRVRVRTRIRVRRPEPSSRRIVIIVGTRRS